MKAKKIKSRSKIGKDGNIAKLTYCDAITLISLVITIIILIILAGITINFALGKNGIFNRAKQAKSQYEISTAREKLELVLLDATTQKEVNKDYNNEEFLDKMLEKNGIEVNGSSVTVDNQVFLIDRDKLIVLESLGKTNIRVTKQVKSYKGKNQNNKYEVEALITIQSNKELESITIKNPYGITTQMTEEELKTGKNIVLELDEEYIITIITKDGKEETRKIVEKSEEIIYSAKELAEFRDKVNTGLTYEGKTIKLGNDIDLAGICGENVNGEEVNWIPIVHRHTGEEEKFFEGTFNGQYKTIKNLYINIDKNNIEKYENENYLGEINNFGLFGVNGGKIENLIMENVNIYVDSSSYSKATSYNLMLGAVVGLNLGEIRNIGIKSGSITSINITKPNIQQRTQLVGGIAGGSYNEGNSIYNSYNNANIYVIDSEEYSSNLKTLVYAGGIVAQMVNNGGATIKNCYNIGDIECNKGYTNAIGGILGVSNYALIENCYNYGKISGVGASADNDCKAGIIGIEMHKGIITNVYCNKASATCSYYEINKSGIKTTGMVEEEELKGYAQTLNGTAEENEKMWLEDNTGINNGYPILKWQIPENR